MHKRKAEKQNRKQKITERGREKDKEQKFGNVALAAPLASKPSVG